MASVLWMIAVPAGLLFAFCAVGNWAIIVALIFRQIERSSLLFPYLGPIFGIVFFLTVPVGGLALYWWLAFLIEPTWILAIFAMLWLFAKEGDKPGDGPADPPAA